MSLLTTPVSNLTQECFIKFNDALRRAKSPGAQDPLDSRLADFNLWVENIGAMAKSGASLDSRFRARPDDLALVKSILSMLADFLAEYVDILEEGRLITDALANIDSSIKNLALIGVAIRRTGKASRSRRANQSFDPDEHHELRRHLECLILIRSSEGLPQLDGLGISDVNELIQSRLTEVPEPDDTLAAKLKQPVASKMEELSPSKLNGIQKRLIEANLRRRHNFLLAQKRSRHVRKLAEHSITADEQQLEETPHQFSKPIPKTRGLAHELKNQQSERKAPATITGFSTASTAEGTLLFNLARKRQPTPSIARSQISFIAANTEFPKPPSLSPHQLVFRCPCCCQSLPSEEFTSPNRWKQHLIEDLCPYTCIAQSCPTPDLLFTTRKAWELHIENDHPPQWQCLLCDRDDEPFSSKADITTHIETHHHEELLNYTLPSLVSWAEVRHMGIRSCPLCLFDRPQDSPELVDHAVRHAYEFALRALPWPELTQENLNRPIRTFSLPEDVSAAERLAKWLSETSPDSAKETEASPFDKADHGFRENVDCVVGEDYFASNNYFEDQASANSSKRQTAQARSSIKWSASSEEDLSSQHNQIESTQSQTELMTAVRDGNLAAVEHLIANIDYEGEVRQKAMKCAVQGGHIEIVEQLLERGVDINARYENGQTALFSAIKKRDPAMMQYLIESGTDSNIKDENNQTALLFALEEYKSIDEEDFMGHFTEQDEALEKYRSKKYEFEQMMESLFTEDVYKDFRHYYGQTPFSWAQSKGNFNMALIIYDWLRETPLLAAQDIYNFEDHDTVARNVKQGDDWFAVFNPLERVLDIKLVDMVEHTSTVNNMAFSHDGKYLATVSETATWFFDIETGEIMCELDNGAEYVCFSLDGRSLATVDEDKLLRVWDIATKAVRHEFLVQSERFSALCFSYDGSMVASGCRDGTVRIWDIEQSIEVQKFKCDHVLGSTAISPNNCFAAAGCKHGRVYIWRLNTDALGKNVRQLKGHGSIVVSTSFSSDSRYLVTSGCDETIKMWDCERGTCLKTLTGHTSNVHSAYMTPDNRWIISGSEDGSIRFWDATTGASQCVVQTQDEIWVRQVALAPSGKYFATRASGSDTLSIWSYGLYKAT